MRKEWRRQKKEREANKKANQEMNSQDMTSFNSFQSYGQLPTSSIDFY